MNPTDQKKYFKWTLYFSLLTSFLLFLFIELIDPYGENHNRLGFERTFSNRPLRTAKYLDTLSKEPHTLIFGTSRSVRITPDIVRSPIINLQVIYGNPYAVIDFLHRLDTRQVNNVIQIYYLLDMHVFNGKEFYDPVDYESPLFRIIYKIKKLNTRSIEKAVEKVKLNFSGSFPFYIHEKGYQVSLVKKDWFIPPFKTDCQVFTEDTIAQLKEIDRFAKHHGIDIVYFTPVLSEEYIRLMDFDLFLEQKKMFLKYIEGFYDFTFVTGLSDNHTLLDDPSHLSYDGLKLLFDQHFVPEQYVTEKKVGTCYSILKEHFTNKRSGEKINSL